MPSEPVRLDTLAAARTPTRLITKAATRVAERFLQGLAHQRLMSAFVLSIRWHVGYAGDLNGGDVSQWCAGSPASGGRSRMYHTQSPRHRPGANTPTHLPLPPPTKLADGLGLKDAPLTTGEIHPNNGSSACPRDSHPSAIRRTALMLCRHPTTSSSDHGHLRQLYTTRGRPQVPKEAAPAVPQGRPGVEQVSVSTATPPAALRRPSSPSPNLVVTALAVPPVSPDGVELLAREASTEQLKSLLRDVWTFKTQHYMSWGSTRTISTLITPWVTMLVTTFRLQT